MGLHVALLAWASTRAQPEPPRAPAQAQPIELIELAPQTEGPLAIRAGGSPTGAREQPAPTTRAEPEPTPEATVEPTPPPPEPAPRPRRSRRSIVPAPLNEQPPSGPPEPEPTAEPEATLEAEPTLAASRAAAPGSASDGAASGSGAGTATHLGDGRTDHSAYGAELARLILRELDRDPVPGLDSGDSITLLLRVRPDGRLLPVGDRANRVGVLASTLGPLRARAIMRRVERASQRFPAHPSGFPRRYYEMDLTVHFRDAAPSMARR